MGKYRRMTLAERCQIDAYMQAGFSITEISRRLGFHKSSVSRELRRIEGRKKYSYSLAQRHRAEQQALQGRKIMIRGELEDRVMKLLFSFLSPEQISGRIRSELGLKVSPQTIYSYVKSSPELKCFLRRRRTRGRGRYGQRKAKWANKLHISKRPKIIDHRRRIGDWERDAMYLANKHQLLVFTDRKSKYTKITKMEKLCSSWVNKKTKEVLKKTGKKVHSITNDNGTEFRGDEDIGVPIYYCTPMKPQQRGTVENTIGLLRQFLKRTDNLNSYSSQDLQLIEDYINHRPRKGLGYRTPYEVFYGTTVALVT